MDLEKQRKPGRPRKYQGGRINATVRFTPQTYAKLKAAADRNGRSVSEQVEFVVERAFWRDEMVNEMLAHAAVAELEHA
jgi:hypothetical protein